MIAVNRREIKYGLLESDYYRLEKTLSQVLTPDKNNGIEGYNIRSLYFDSLDNIDYYQKASGDEVRKKIRLRIYNPSDTKVKLEIKRKMNINQRKETIVITKEDALKLIDKDYSVLLKYDNPVAKAAYNIMTTGQYRPVVLIDYRRKAFIHKENNIRVTLDSDIRSNESDFRMFEDDVMMTPCFLNYNALLEIKYDGDMFCWVTDFLNAPDSTLQSLSKYCVGRKFFSEHIA